MNISKEDQENWEKISDLHKALENLYYCIYCISDYCKSNQSCTKCLIKEWCKEKRKQCPEEWRRK